MEIKEKLGAIEAILFASGEPIEIYRLSEASGVDVGTLLYHLAATPNRVYTRNQLLDEVWGFDYFGDSRTVDVHIKRLREKLEGVSDQWELKTVWGVGYKFMTEGA